MPPALPIYLDNHATTRVDPRVLEAMLPFFTESYGNAASRSHRFGYQAKSAVETARTQVADLLGCSAKEIIWTSGATESNNLAILGAARGQAKRGTHIVTLATEHKAVLDPVEALGSEGFEVQVLPVSGDGTLDLQRLESALRPDTLLVSAMAANNEVGVLHDLAAIGEICRRNGTIFHCDAAQACTIRPLPVRDLGIDLLSLSAHKMYGPKGVGALYVRRGRPKLKLIPLLFGGGHERGMRSGTLDVPGIVGMGAAAVLAREELPRVDQLRTRRDRLFDGIIAALSGVHLNGPPLDNRAANNLNLSFDGIEAEALLMAIRDIAVSTGSACTSATLEPSHVLRALGIEADRAHSSLRFGLGRFNTDEEIDYVIQRVAASVTQLRAMRPLYEDPEDPEPKWPLP
jgi:cysteine desulfurase